MSEPFLALLLVIQSANGSSVVFRWPSTARQSARLARPLPSASSALELDYPWRAFASAPSQPQDAPVGLGVGTAGDDDDYEWRTPTTTRPRPHSFVHPAARPASGRSSPNAEFDLSASVSGLSVGGVAAGCGDEEDPDDYRTLLGFTSKLLASLLLPTRELCHQRFELVIDELVFLGHPVCADARGKWKFKSLDSRGRGERPQEPSSGDEKVDGSEWLEAFQLVVVLDQPDPSSSAAGNQAKYLDTVYEQIAFTFAAVLFQEQVISKFVERECGRLSSLREQSISHGRPYAEYVEEALATSSIASSIKTLYESIKGGSVARLRINGLALELQLPPALGDLLAPDIPAPEVLNPDDPDAEDGDIGSGSELWRLPSLKPWNSLLLLDTISENGAAIKQVGDGNLGAATSASAYMSLHESHVEHEDRTTAEGLFRFLELAQITNSLADMATMLEWDLESQVYPTVRWLVQHRRAMVVDVVHQAMKTQYALRSPLPAPLADLCADFTRAFGPSVPTLRVLLATLSSAQDSVLSRVPGMHIELLRWLLQRRLLVRLHLRIRVVVPPALKAHVAAARARRAALAKRGRGGALPVMQEASEEGADGFFPFSPRAARIRTRGLSPAAQEKGEKVTFEDVEDSASASDEDEVDRDEGRPSVIEAPGAATPLQRRWLAAMSENKDPVLATQFNQINQYFDGRRTDDEIMYRAGIKRRDLREILHDYDEYLETFLHP